MASLPGASLSVSCFPTAFAHIVSLANFKLLYLFRVIFVVGDFFFFFFFFFGRFYFIFILKATIIIFRK